MFKSISRFFRKRFDRFYRQKRWHLILDISLIVVILLLVIAVLSLHFYNPKINIFSNGNKVPENNQGAVKITEPPIEANLTWEKEIINPQETPKIAITLKNKASVAVVNYKLILSSRNNNFAASSELVVPELAPNSEQSFTLDVELEKLSNAANKVVSLKAEQSYQAANQLFKDSYNLPDIKVASELKVLAAAYYNSPQGDQLGSGPLPPVVGLPTNFWIFLKAEADGEFENFSLSAKLPSNVELTDNSSLLAGNLNYNEAARQIVWQIEKIDADSSEYRAGFEVQLIPEEAQAGKLATLLNQLRFQGEDSFTGVRLEGTAASVDTGLEADALNRGEGKIILSEVK